MVFAAPVGRKSNASDAAKSASSIQLYNLEDDVSETMDLRAKYPDIVEDLTALLEEQIKKGRSTPGIIQKNDTEVTFKSFPKDRWARAK